MSQNGHCRRGGIKIGSSFGRGGGGHSIGRGNSASRFNNIDTSRLSIGSQFKYECYGSLWARANQTRNRITVTHYIAQKGILFISKLCVTVFESVPCLVSAS